MCVWINKESTLYTKMDDKQDRRSTFDGSTTMVKIRSSSGMAYVQYTHKQQKAASDAFCELWSS